MQLWYLTREQKFLYSDARIYNYWEAIDLHKHVW